MTHPERTLVDARELRDRWAHARCTVPHNPMDCSGCALAAALERVEALEELLREIHEWSPETSDSYEDPTCYFCNCGFQRDAPEYETRLMHAADCWWIRATEFSTPAPAGTEGGEG